MNIVMQDSASPRVAGPRRKWTRRRALRLLTGLGLIACSLALIAGGVLAAVASSGNSYLGLASRGSYTSNRYGLATQSTNWRRTLFGWADAVRLSVASQDGKPIFVGVGPAGAVDRYLSGASYTTVGARAGHAGTGGPPPGAPARAVHWTASSQGAGTRTLRWKATDVPQIALAMNADRSRPVRVRVLSSAVTLDRMPWWISGGLVALAVLVLAAATRLILRPLRDRGQG